MSQCQEPTCRRNSSETYSGKHGNTLELCPKHYYELVADEDSGRSILPDPVGVGTDTVQRGLIEQPTPVVTSELDTATGPGLRAEKLRGERE